jgi:hypothetical protein
MPARWLGHSSPAVTLGYYAHFMPEAGSKGCTAIDGEVLPDCTALELAVKCKAIELWGLWRC